MIIKFLPLIGAFNVSMIYLMVVGGVAGALVLFLAAEVFGNFIFTQDDKKTD